MAWLDSPPDVELIGHWCPISGYRLNRAGDRQLNCALHTIVLTRLQHDPTTRAYAARRLAEGKTRARSSAASSAASPAACSASSKPAAYTPTATPRTRGPAPSAPALDRHRSLLAIALGIRTCLAGHRVAFLTATEWVALPADAQRHGRLDDELARLQRIPLLIVDEVGYIPLTPQAANLMFMLVSRRYGRTSLIVSSNEPRSAWARSSATTSSPPR